MNEPREYKNPVFQTAMVVIGFGIMLFVFIIIVGKGQAGFVMLPFAGIILFFALFALYFRASKTIISEDEISSTTIFGTKTLKWSEITRVSGSGYGIKLHDFDGDVTVAPSPQIPGYEEVVEWIGVKRPDLFNPQKYSEMSRGLAGVLAQLFGGLIVIGAGAFAFISADAENFIFPFVFALTIGLVIIGMMLFAPWSVSIQGNSIVVGYLFNQKTLTADKIASVHFGYSQNRNGRIYYMQIARKQGSGIRISSLKPNLPVAYLVLKNWHKKNA